MKLKITRFDEVRTDIIVTGHDNLNSTINNIEKLNKKLEENAQALSTAGAESEVYLNRVNQLNDALQKSGLGTIADKFKNESLTLGNPLTSALFGINGNRIRNDRIKTINKDYTEIEKAIESGQTDITKLLSSEDDWNFSSNGLQYAIDGLEKYKTQLELISKLDTTKVTKKLTNLLDNEASKFLSSEDLANLQQLKNSLDLEPKGLRTIARQIGETITQFQKLKDEIDESSNKLEVLAAKPALKETLSDVKNLELNARGFKEVLSATPNINNSQQIAELEKQFANIKKVTDSTNIKLRFDEAKPSVEQLNNLLSDSASSIQALNDILGDVAQKSVLLQGARKVTGVKGSKMGYFGRGDTLVKGLNTPSIGSDSIETRCMRLAEALDKTDSANKRAIQSTNDLNDANKKAASTFGSLNKAIKGLEIAKLVTLYHTIKYTFSWMLSSAEEAGKYIESLNLFQLAFGQFYEGNVKVAKSLQETRNLFKDNQTSLEEWRDTLTDKVFVDPSDTMQMTGAFFNLTRGLGVAADKAKIMSMNLTQLSYDMSSYLNIDVSEANTKLVSGMSGQSRALAKVGVAMQNASLQELAYELGIETLVTEMNQADKTMLRYLQIMRSTEQMQGDLGATLQTPANTIRMLRTQFKLLKRDVGEAFGYIIQAIAPVVMAVGEVLRDIAKNISSFIRGMFGLKEALPEKKTLKDLSSGYDEYADSVEGAAGKINRSLAPFDELNVVENKSSGSGSNYPTIDWDKYFDDEIYNMFDRYKEGIQDKIDEIKPIVEGFLKGMAVFLGGTIIYKILKGVTNFVHGVEDIGSTFKKLFGFNKKNNTSKTSSDVVNGMNDIKTAKEASEPVAQSLGTRIKSTFADGVIGLEKLAFFILGSVAVITAIALVGQALGSMTDPKTVFDFYASLLPALPTLAAVGVGIKVFGEMPKDNLVKGLATVAAILGGTVVLVEAVGALMSVPGFKDFLSTGIQAIVDTFEGIQKVIIPIAALTGLSYIASLGSSTILPGVGVLALIIGGLDVLVLAIGGLLSIPGWENALDRGIDATVRTFKGIGEILIPLTGLTALSALAGLGAETIIPGLGVLGLVVAATAVVMYKLGELIQNPMTDTFIDRGIEILVKVFNGIGQVAGAIVGGIAEGVSTALPGIGSNLSAFAKNSQGFFDAMKTMDESTIKGIETVSTLVLKLGATSFLTALAGLPGVVTSLVTYLVDLPALGKGIKKFGDNVKGMDADVALNAARAGEAIANIGDHFKTGGIKQLWEGTPDWNMFNTELPKFGEGMALVAKYLQGFSNSDVTAIGYSTQAAQKIADLYSKLQKTDGVSQWFSGTANMTKFLDNVNMFAIKMYYISTLYAPHFTSELPNQIENARSAIDHIIRIEEYLSKNKAIDGSRTKAFVEKMEQTAETLKTFGDSVKGVDYNNATNASNTINSFIGMAERIKNTGTESTLSTFLSGIKSGAVGLSSSIQSLFSNSQASDIGYSFGYNLGASITTGMKKTLKANIKLTDQNNGAQLTTLKLATFAEGGYPKSGEMFFANENGRAEFVGKVGNKTAVANQDQMVQAITNALTSGFSQLNAQQSAPQNLTVMIGNEKVWSGQINHQNDEIDRYGSTRIIKI